MELHERVRELRKKHLKMTQSEFAERLGVSRSVINNIERNVLARPEQKIPMLRLMCKIYKVNEEWLLEGKGEVFASEESFELESFLEKNRATEIEKEIIRLYFEMDPDLRMSFINHFAGRFKTTGRIDDEVELYRKKLEASVDEKVEAFRQELEAERKGGTSTLSVDTEINAG